MLSDDPTLEEIEAVFANDRFATEAAGCRVVSGERGRAVCSLEVYTMRSAPSPRIRKRAGAPLESHCKKDRCSII